jgi:two-component system NtrC family sensor kinase
LKLIISEALRAAHIVRSLLDFARQRPAERRPAQINDLLSKSLELVAYELRTHRVGWTMDLAPDIPMMMVDPHQMQQVFVNLINNAWQAVIAEKEEGNIRIVTCLARPAFPGEFRGGAKLVRIMIQDDGPGIPAENLSRIFDPFFTTKAEGKGTGLGLAVCHGIVTEHGGNIRAESAPGEGSSFWIELPVVAVIVPPTARPPPSHRFCPPDSPTTTSCHR